jgi:hypothetical protein
MRTLIFFDVGLHTIKTFFSFENFTPFFFHSYYSWKIIKKSSSSYSSSYGKFSISGITNYDHDALYEYVLKKLLLLGFGRYGLNTCA